MEEFNFERINKDNLVHLIQLYKVCFSTKTDLEFLAKKYNTERFGAQYIGYLAIHKQTNEVAAYYGVFPILGELNGNNVLMAQSGDTMTNPKFQGKGLFIKLAKLTYELAKNESINFVFGFPNKNSYPGFINKLSWQHKSDIHNYIIQTRVLPLEKIAKKFTLFAPIYAKFVHFRLKSILTNEIFDNSIKRLESGKGFITHDERFFDYKSYYKSLIIKQKGIKSIIKIDGRLWVGDLDIKNMEEAEIAIKNLVLLAKKIACSSIHFSVFNQSFLDEFLSKKYSISSKSPVGYLSLNDKFNPDDFVFQTFDFDTF